MKTHAFIFARGGSKGVPGKNIRPLAGKPLLLHSLDIARQLNEIDRVFVSTEAAEIAAIAQTAGATLIPRPAELAQDDSPEWLAWRHAIDWVRREVGPFERFLSLPATAPLRLADDVRHCLSALDADTDMVVTMTPSQRSPWFNMVSADAQGRLQRLMQGRDPYSRRQDAPQAYDLTTLAYVARPDFILSHDNLWQGRVRGVIIPQARAIDIDTAFDFKIADWLLRERQASTDSGAQAEPPC
ncbi:MAG: acylneuraminate cytidylyltransferase family protein [Chromatiaceae bacterium]|nr:acylneuraminate cytidylyltransferase family protein [Chromatiaceae bacterium]